MMVFEEWGYQRDELRRFGSDGGQLGSTLVPHLSLGSLRMTLTKAKINNQINLVQPSQSQLGSNYTQ